MVEGQLKLIDFGIAKAIKSDTTSIARESQVLLTPNIKFPLLLIQNLKMFKPRPLPVFNYEWSYLQPNPCYHLKVTCRAAAI